MSLQEDQMKGLLYEELAAYGKSDFYPYHMPGHKRSHNAGAFSEFFQIDITEIDGFDNLHQAQGILKRAQERAASLYGSEETFFLVNGSTCGILAAICAAADKGDTVLIARNCHKSVYHAAFLQELRLRYLYPEQIAEYGISDAVSPTDVEAALEQYPECNAVVITSPTYEGIIADIREIARIVHEKNKILIVDEAHGAHLGLAEGIYENAVRQEADIVIHSLHKTLPSMTQTALLHVNGSRVNRGKLRRYLRIYQSSSPSYVLMASMDSCIAYMKDASACFARLRRHYQHFMKQMEKCRYIDIGNPKALPEGKYHFAAWDICKIVIFIKSDKRIRMSGQRLYDVLREEFHLQPEMAAGNYVLAIMTIADEEVGWQRLADALLEIDDKIDKEVRASDKNEMDNAFAADNGMYRKAENKRGIIFGMQPVKPEVKLTIAEAFHRVDSGTGSIPADNGTRHGGIMECGDGVLHAGREVPLAQAAGEVAGDFINLYPPGIPLLVPGEVIDTDMIKQIEEYQELGLPVQGISDAGCVIIC